MTDNGIDRFEVQQLGYKLQVQRSHSEARPRNDYFFPPQSDPVQGCTLCEGGALKDYSEQCPICGGHLSKSIVVDQANLEFLSEMAENGKINDSLALLRVVWQNIPQLRHATDSELIKELSRTTLDNVQEKVNRVLEPMKTFIETFPKVIEKLPDSLREDFRERFDENRIALEKEFRALRDLAPKSEEMTKMIQTVVSQIEDINQKKINEAEQTLSERFREKLENMGFPEPEQLRLLAQLIPATLPLLEELVRFQKVPTEKGKRGELELMEQLHDYYPEDDCKPLGNSGDTDLLAIPRFNGSDLSHKILIESKKNGSGWSRSFIQETRTHMKLRGERFAILAVEKMPKGANGFLFEQCPEGVVLVTDREYFRVAYGSTRASLIALQPFGHSEISFSKLFADQKINEAVKEAYHYCGWAKKIREKAKRIETNANGINQDIDELDKLLRRSLNDLQTRINNAINQFAPTECNGSPSD
jgi:hypothetical protein